MNDLHQYFKDHNVYQLDESLQQQLLTLMDKFIQENQNRYDFTDNKYQFILKCSIQMLEQQDDMSIKQPSAKIKLKYFQLIRLLTREKTLLSSISNPLQLITKLCQQYSHLSGEQGKEDAQNVLAINCEILSIIKRFKIDAPTYTAFIKTKFLAALTESLKMPSNRIIVKSVLDFIFHMFDEQIQNQNQQDDNGVPNLNQQVPKEVLLVLNELHTFSNLHQLYTCYENGFKMQIANLLPKMIIRQGIEHFRAAKWPFLLMREFKCHNAKEQGNNNMKISVLNCISKLIKHNELLLTFKSIGFLDVLQEILSGSVNYMEILLVINILSQLAMDDEMAFKELALIPTLVQLLVHSHPSLLVVGDTQLQFQNYQIKNVDFKEIESSKRQMANTELQTHCARLLRFLFSIERGRAVIKLIFPPSLMVAFVDVGNFQQSANKYRQTITEFNNLNEKEIKSMLQKLENLNQNRANQMVENITSSSNSNSNSNNSTSNNSQNQIGKYQVVETLGKGAFGTVFLVKSGGNQFALKQIPNNNQLDNNNSQIMVTEQQKDKQKSRQMSEVEIYQELQHPNIVHFLHSFSFNDTLCLVLEYIEGFNLNELIRIHANKSMQRFSEEMIWKVLIDIASVLNYLHNEKEVVHRDLNPSNIMVDFKSNVKITDFGLAKHITHAMPVLHSFVGTLIYTCPEIVKNLPYTGKADVWSFGCILYEMIMLKPPFTGSNPLKLANEIVQADYQPMDNIYSNELLEIVEKCLIQNEDNRPSILQIIQEIPQRILQYVDVLKLQIIKKTNQVEKLISQNIYQQQINDQQQAKEKLKNNKTEDIQKNSDSDQKQIPLKQHLQTIEIIQTIVQLCCVQQTNLRNSSNFQQQTQNIASSQIIQEHEQKMAYATQQILNKVIMCQKYCNDKSEILSNFIQKIIQQSKEEIILQEESTGATFEEIYFYLASQQNPL